MFGRRRKYIPRYLPLSPPQQVQPPPASQTAQQPQVVVQVQAPQAVPDRKKGHRFGRAAVGTMRVLGGVMEFLLWLILNLTIVFVVIMAAQAAGVNLPPWLAAITNFTKGVFTSVAKNFGF